MVIAAVDDVNARRKLFQLFTGASVRHNILWNNREALSAIWKKSRETSDTLKDLKVARVLQELSPKAKSMSKLLVYLGLVESIGTTLIDLVLMLLIANGEEMHITRGPGIKHVSTPKELRKLDLAYKLYFLESHQLGYFAKLIDRNLRNDIAHLKFEIEENGAIRDSNKNVRNIDDVISNFWARVYTIISFFDDFKFRDCWKKRQPNDLRDDVASARIIHISQLLLAPSYTNRLGLSLRGQ